MNSVNDLSYKVIGCAMKIHDKLGCGLLESVYHECLKYELTKENIAFKSEVFIPVNYETLFIESGFKSDLIIEDKIIIELKSVEKITDNHKAQTLTYLKMSNLSLALLINFKESMLKNRIHRFINTFDKSVSSVKNSASSV